MPVPPEWHDLRLYFGELGLEAAGTVGRFTLAAWMQAKASVYRNGHGFQAGNQVLGGARASSDLWLPRWRFTVGALIYREEAERWNGQLEDEGNLGRTDVLVETQVAWRFAGQWTVALGLKIPVWTASAGEQLSTPAFGEIAFEHPFKLLK